MAKTPGIEETKKLMGALVRQPPKLHEEMKVGKAADKRKPAKKERKAKGKDGN